MDVRSVFDLPPEEKLPLYDWQIKEIEESAAEYAEDPSSGLSWEEVKRRIREKHGR